MVGGKIPDLKVDLKEQEDRNPKELGTDYLKKFLLQRGGETD